VVKRAAEAGTSNWSQTVDAIKAGVVEQLLLECRRSVLRVVFINAETYDLTLFAVAQDDDESVPHVTATVVRSVRASAKASKLFPEHSVMFFSLAEVRTIRDVATDAVLFDVEADTNP
jgi:hypothetical protein